MSARLRVRVHPGARRERIGPRAADGAWRIEVRAVAEGGRANEAVVELIAEALGKRRSEVRVAAGAGSRSKVIEIDGAEQADVEARLAQVAQGESRRR